MHFECFYCDKSFTQVESLAANTTELQSKTYCSRVCEDTDTEAINRSVKEEQERIAEYNQTHEAEIKELVTKQVGAFKLTVKTKKESE